MLVVVPPFDEQKRIVAILDAHDACVRAEKAILDKRHLIEHGLMGDLLTGKVQVDS